MREKKLKVADFARPAMEVATRLLGCTLVKSFDGMVRRARIAEVEAYLGPKDLASHASKGLTRRTQVLYGPPGHAYVYFIYGLHFMLNVVVGSTGMGEAILIRAADPLDGWDVDLAGPAKLAKHFEITAAENTIAVTGDQLYFTEDRDYRPKIVRRKRVGIDYAGHWKHRLLRFIDERSPVARQLKY